MTYFFYKILHLVALFALFLGMGISLGAPEQETKLRKWGSILHGISLLVILVSGFGLLAKIGTQSPIPGWVLAKLGVWVLLGSSLVIIKRQLLQAWLISLVILVLAFMAILFALYKPF